MCSGGGNWRLGVNTMPLARVLSICLSVVLAGVVMKAASQARPTQFENQLDADWEYWISQYPEFATQIGRPEYDDHWTDYSAAAIEARAKFLRDSLQKLTAVGPDTLPREDQVSYDLYRDLLSAAVEGLTLHYDALPIRSVVPNHLLMPLNQLGGVQQDAPRTIALMRHDTVTDYENIIARLQRLPALIGQTIALMELGLAAGITQPQIVMRGVPAQVKAQIVADPSTSPLLDAFEQFPSGIAASERSRLTARARSAYTDDVAPAFARLYRFLEEKYLPRCREAIAVDALPKGAELYRYNVAWHTTTNLTPKQIHQTGLAEVKRIRTEMDKVIASSGFKGSFSEFTRFLRTDPQFYFTDADALVASYREIAKRADPELARLFGVLPRLPYGVRRVPDAIAPSQTTAYYEPGSPAAGRPGYMYANTYKLDSRPRWEMEALTLHEAVPGHHLQIALAQELAGLPEFRKHGSYTAYVEGWALYSELLGEDMGFYTDPYSRFGQLTYQMWRAVRLVVDTGMHALGWSRQQAIDFFRENSAKTEQDIVVEIDRYIAWPGQALGYKIGELRIRELREKAEKALGSRFDVRSFHDALHTEGAVPLALLEARVDAWITSRR
jgi:uncharacterized protein (DUF885 family)